MDDKLKFIEPVTVMAGEYPDVALRHCYMDTASMEVIRQPWAFDVVVTNNVFGDIIADELVQISGTPALFGSAELTPAGRGHLCDSAAAGCDSADGLSGRPRAFQRAAPTMFADLSACGGILTMAAGFRVSRIKSGPLVDLMPALILVMPFSMLWIALMG